MFCVERGYLDIHSSTGHSGQMNFSLFRTFDAWRRTGPAMMLFYRRQFLSHLMKKRVFLFSKCIRMHTIVCKINYSGIGFDCEICLYMVHYQLNWALTSGAVRNERIAVTSNGWHYEIHRVPAAGMETDCRPVRYTSEMNLVSPSYSERVIAFRHADRSALIKRPDF